jgi:hypothetical protein
VTDSIEVIPILENFIRKHPDFSWHGARGIIALTGYNGILGYRTSLISAPGWADEKGKALKVVERLRQTGWVFASHGWAHPDCIRLDEQQLSHDIEMWDKYVRPLVGDTVIFVYPYGNALNTKNPKFQLLLNDGFREFFGVCPVPNLKFCKDFVLFDRIPIDGQFLRGEVFGSRSSSLFSIQDVIDSTGRPKKKFHIGNALNHPHVEGHPKDSAVN